jgi:methyl-accepting chemotaxis protein
VRYALWIVVPIITLGLFVTFFGLKIGRQLVDNQKQQLMLQISTLEESFKYLDAGMPTKSAIEKTKNNIRNLKILSQDMVAVNSMEFGRLMGFVLLAMLVIIIGAVMLGVFLTHRIAGPMFHLKRAIWQMTREINDEPIRVRVTDEFKELASALDELRKVLRSNTFLRKDAIARLTQLIDRMNSGQPSQANRQDLDMLKAEIASLEKLC